MTSDIFLYYSFCWKIDKYEEEDEHKIRFCASAPVENKRSVKTTLGPVVTRLVTRDTADSVTIVSMSVTLGDIKAAAARIGGHVHRTEVRTCETFNRMAGDKQLFFKCEMWQKTGSFKARGDIQYF